MGEIDQSYRQLEAALRQSEARLQRLAANVLGVIYQFRLHPDGRTDLPFISNNCLDFFERDSSTLKQDVNALTSLIHPDDRAEFDRSVAQSASTLQSWEWEGRFLLPSGQIRWIRAASHPEKQATGEILWDGLLVDITAAKQEESDRKQAVAALEAQEQLLRTVYDGVEQAIFVLDVAQGEFRYVAMNAFVRREAGIGSRDITGKTPTEVFGDRVGGFMQQRLQQCLQANATLTHEDEFTLREQTRWSLNTLSPVRDETGQVYRIVGTGVDITDRKQAEAALKDSETRYRRIFESVSDGLSIVDLETGEIVEANRAFCTMHGYTYEEFTSLHPSAFVHPSSAHLFPEFLSTIRSGQQFNCEAVDVRRDGTSIDVEVKGTSLMMKDCLYGLSIVRDISGRKRAEKTLMLYKRAVDSSSDAIGMTDPEGALFYQNTAYTELFGCETPEIFNQTGGTAACYPKQESIQAIAQAIATGQSWVGEVEQRSRNGRRFPAYVRAYGIRDESENLLGLVSIITDITDRKRAEEALRYSEQRFRDVSEAAGEYIWEIDSNGVYTFITEQAKLVKGFEPAELLGHSPLEFMPAEDAESVQFVLQSAITRKDSFKLEHRNLLKSGEIVWEEVKGLPVLDDQGELIGWRGVGLSITAAKRDEIVRKQAEAALREQEQFFRNLYEGVENVIVIVDVVEVDSGESQFRFVGWNPTTERITGIPSATIVGKTPPEVLGAVYGTEVQQNYQRCLDVGTSISYEEYLPFQGRDIWWLTTVNPLKDENGKIYRMVLTAFEITDRKQVETDLWETQQFLESVLQALPIAVFAKEAKELRFAMWNSAASNLFGLTQEDVIGKNDYDFFPKHQADAFRQADRAVLNSQRITEIPAEEAQIKGETRILRTKKTTALDATGEPKYLVAIVEDITDRKQAETALRQSQEQLDAIINNSPAAIYLKDLQGRYLVMNRKCLTLFNISLEQSVGKTDYDLFPKEIADGFRANDLEVLSTKAFVEREELALTVDGLRTFIGAKFPLLDENGEPYAVCGISTDITDRKQAETALRQSQEQLDAIINNSPAAIYLKDRQGHYLVVNRKCVSLFGTSLEQRMGKTDHDLFPKEIADEFRATDLEVLTTKTFVEREELALTVNGLRTFISAKFPLLDEEGEPYALCGISTDITDRKQAEEDLRQKAQQEQLLNQLANQIRSSLDIDRILEAAVGSIRDLLQIDRCNFVWYRPHANPPTWECVYEAKSPELPTAMGLYPSSVIGSTAVRLQNLEVIREDDTAATSDPLWRQVLLSLGMKSHLSIPILTSTGAIGVVSCSQHQAVRPWKNSEVELLKSVANQLAIALNQADLYKESRLAAETAQAQAQQLEHALQELWRTQAKLVQTEKMSGLGQLVAGVAHEINNPVNFIHGNLVHAGEYAQDLLRLIALYQQHYPAPNAEIQAEAEAIDLNFLTEDLPKLLTSMKVGTDRIREIVLALRNFSRIDEAEMKTVDIHEGIDSTLLILQNRLKEKPDCPGIQVNKQYGPLPPVTCYAGQLNQVFMNILTNAIDALEERDQQRSQQEIKQNPSQIHVITQKNPSSVSIRIIDNGPGIPEAIQKRLFDPFFTTKPVGKGTGLGMSISHQIITEKHNGSLCCTSSPGQGTEFTIEIPLKLAGS